MHSPRTATEAFDRLDDMQAILRDLAHYREAREQVIWLQYDVDLQYDKLVISWYPLTERAAKWMPC